MTYEEIKKCIIDTINLPDKLEPYFMVGENYNRLTNQSDKIIYLQVVKELLICGDLNQRFCCIVGISIMQKNIDFKVEIKYCADNFDSVTEIKLVSHLLYACAEISEDWSLKFIKQVINEFKSPYAKFNSIYDKYNIYSLSIRCLAYTSRWVELIIEINDAYTLFNDITFIDELAFFKRKRGVEDFERLLMSFSKENSDRVLILSSDIEMRYQNYN